MPAGSDSSSGQRGLTRVAGRGLRALGDSGGRAGSGPGRVPSPGGTRQGTAGHRVHNVRYRTDHVAAGCPAPPAAQPRSALPKSYLLKCDALRGVRASLLLPPCLRCAPRGSPAFRPHIPIPLCGGWRAFGGHILIPLLWRWRGCSAQSVGYRKAVAVRKAALGFLQRFYRLLVWEGETKGKGGNSGIREEKNRKRCLEPSKQNCTHDKLGRERFLGCSQQNKVRIISEPLVHHLRTCSARNRTPPGDSQNNFQEEKGSC